MVFGPTICRIAYFATMNIPSSMTISSLVLVMLLSCGSPSPGAEASSQEQADTINQVKDAGAQLANIKLPPGFKIDYFAEDVENARSMDLSPSGILYVGTR